MFGDNTASLAIIENPVHHDRTKHIAIKYFFIRELVEAGVISMDHVGTLNNYADIGTKALGRNKFEENQGPSMGHGELERPRKRRRAEQSGKYV
jgi:hypothetical protein